MTEAQIKQLILQNVDFPADFPADFEINDSLLESDYSLIIPNIFPGGVSIVNELGKLVEFPQYEIYINNKYGVKIDFFDFFLTNTGILYNPDPVGELSSSSDSSSSSESSDSSFVSNDGIYIKDGYIWENIPGRTINGWKIRYNRGKIGETPDDENNINMDDIIKYAMIF